MNWPTTHTKYMKQQEIDYMIRDYDFSDELITEIYYKLQEHYQENQND
jgi:hypothetical protein